MEVLGYAGYNYEYVKAINDEVRDALKKGARLASRGTL
jgi:hypothetical protein